ncbi:MAG: ABC transporter ATP-binding protein [Phycisphaeraceae bacterium]|nr:ABC transporter ATP-binding protein [Phycisphaeraceae bacterium]
MTLSAASIIAGYASRAVLRDVSFAVQPGRLAAIIGPNGAGKTTLLRVLLGVLGPTGGAVTLADRPLASIPSRERARAIAFIPQASSPALAYSVRQVVALGRLAINEPRQVRDEAARAALSRVGMLDRADEPLGSLSAGQQQRVLLARALAQLDAAGARPTDAAAPSPRRPRFLLADEPVSAMDPRHAIASMGVLKDLAATGVGVAVVLHDFALVAQFADDVLLLDADGRVAAAAPPADVLAPPVLERVFQTPFALATVPGTADTPPIPLASPRPTAD